MATRQMFQVTSELERTIQVLAPAFHGDPVYTWLLHTFDSSEYDSVLWTLFRGFFTQCALNHGLFIEVGGFGSCGLLMPPGAVVENSWTLLQAGLVPALWSIGVGNFMRALLEYDPATERMMKQVFTGDEQKKHWYVFIMGTAVDRRRQGLASVLLEDMQERTRSDGRPLWLQATTERSRDLYLEYGFEDHGEIILVEGKVGWDGLLKKAGEGNVIWSMPWRH